MGLKLIEFNRKWEFHPPTEMDEVNELFWEAVDLMDIDPKRSHQYFLTIIDRFPNSHIDAYVHLSILNREQNKIVESFSYALLAYLIGKKCFPPHFIEDEEEISWLWLENRPFLRACQNLAIAYRLKNEIPQAIELFEENLSYNKGDNQGIRYELLECYFSIQDYDKAKDLIKSYPDDCSIEFTCGTVVLKILTGKKYTNEDINKINNANKYVIRELAKKTHQMPPRKTKGWQPDELEDIYVGSNHEAYLYWMRHKEFLSSRLIVDEFKKIKMATQTPHMLFVLFSYIVWVSNPVEFAKLRK